MLWLKETPSVSSQDLMTVLYSPVTILLKFSSSSDSITKPPAPASGPFSRWKPGGLLIQDWRQSLVSSAGRSRYNINFGINFISPQRFPLHSRSVFWEISRAYSLTRKLLNIFALWQHVLTQRFRQQWNPQSKTIDHQIGWIKTTQTQTFPSRWFCWI